MVYNIFIEILSIKMAKPSKETIELLNNLRTECVSNMTLYPNTDYAAGYNHGVKMCMEFLDHYKNGDSLFQYIDDLNKGKKDNE